MSAAAESQKHVVVIGGGITGLAAAHRLSELDRSVKITLLEASNRLGGVLETVRHDGFLIERSADNFITNIPYALDLCRRLGIEEQLSQTNDAHRRAFVVCRGRLESIPEGFLIMAPSRLWPVLTTPILSWRGKMRLAAEWFVRTGSGADESLASFATRRFGREMYERLAQPLVGGIYTADPEKLSVRAAMPRFVKMEQEYGSLIRGARRGAAKATKANKRESAARYSMFTTPREGMSSLVDALADRLPDGSVRLDAAVKQITQREQIVQHEAGKWSIAIAGDEPRTIEADGVIVATPAHRAATLLGRLDRELAAELEQIFCASCAIVSLGYSRSQIGHPLDGFGFVVPQIERRQILSASFSSVKYAGRAPEGCELIRVFIGGACQADLVDLDDDALRTIAVEELVDLLTIDGEPIFARISRWRGAMPQYHLGHIERIERIRSRAASHHGLALAGNAYGGVGVPQCIQSGEQAAATVVAELKST